MIWVPQRKSPNQEEPASPGWRPRNCPAIQGMAPRKPGIFAFLRVKFFSCHNDLRYVALSRRYTGLQARKPPVPAYPLPAPPFPWYHQTITIIQTLAYQQGFFLPPGYHRYLTCLQFSVMTDQPDLFSLRAEPSGECGPRFQFPFQRSGSEHTDRSKAGRRFSSLLKRPKGIRKPKPGPSPYALLIPDHPVV